MPPIIVVIACRLFGRRVTLATFDPVSRSLARQEREARAKHAPVKHIQAAMTNRLHDALRGVAR